MAGHCLALLVNSYQRRYRSSRRKRQIGFVAVRLRDKTGHRHSSHRAILNIVDERLLAFRQRHDRPRLARIDQQLIGGGHIDVPARFEQLRHINAFRGSIENRDTGGQQRVERRPGIHAGVSGKTFDRGNARGLIGTELDGQQPLQPFLPDLDGRISLFFDRSPENAQM